VNRIAGWAISNLSSGLIAALVAAMVLSGCSIIPAERTEGSGDSNPGAAQSPGSDSGQGPCYDLVQHWDSFVPQTVAWHSSVYPLVFVGSFRGRGTAFWNTPDSLPPASAHAFGSANIYTPLTIVVDTAIRAQTSDGGRATVQGGTVGCSRLALDPSPVDLSQGGRYLFFAMGPGEDSAGVAKNFIVVWRAWPVRDDDIVITPQEGMLPLAHVRAEVLAHQMLGPDVTPPGPATEPDATPTVDTYP
jgi:hypothetical protein